MRIFAVGAAVLAVGTAGCGGGQPSHHAGRTVTRTVAAPRRPPILARLREELTGSLAAPLQDASSAEVDARHALLLGGLTAADVSTSDVTVVSATGARHIGRLPQALHDAAAVRIGSSVYLFGGGNGVAQLDGIQRVNPRTGAVSQVGSLPAPASDVGAASIGNTAYIVGGYTGSHWLNTIVAWTPDGHSHVVAHLPQPLRYAAVTAAGGRVVIAGGSLVDGTASAAVLTFDPLTQRLHHVGSLPAPTTHAAAAAIGSIAYVIGGRGANLGSVTARIVGVDPVAGRVFAAGALTAERSDLSAVSLPGRILLAGGRSATATISTIATLAPARAVRHTQATVNVYAHTAPSDLSATARKAIPRIYVPNSRSNTVSEIDPATRRVIRTFAVGALPQHVTPSWDMKTLWVDNDVGNSLTPINPRNGNPGTPVPVTDPYNLYFTPDGRFAIVVAERLHRLDFRDPHTMRLRHSLDVPCQGVDHMDFSADGSYLIASCEFSAQLIKVDVRSQQVVGTLNLPSRSNMPQDVKLSPDGKVFYVADTTANGVWEIDGARLKVIGFVHTGRGAHGLYPSRDGRLMYITNREEGSISVLDFGTRRIVAKWSLPGGGSPDMGGVSVDGKTLWVSGRYNGVVYAINTKTGRLESTIKVGAGPHGLSVWPQPGRYSLGHTGVTR